MKFNKYYYENFSVDIPFDASNPRYVLSLDGIDDILTEIVKTKPFTLPIEHFKDRRKIEELLYIDALRKKDGKLGLAIPIFTENETDILKDLSYDIAKNISEILIDDKNRIEQIISKIDNGFSNQRNLYHVLCGGIFDGRIFEYLEKNSLVTTSKIHKSGLDYLIICYEQSDFLDNYSNGLLCSYNRLIHKDSGFVSFGDSNGDRKDLYRYFRLNELNRLEEKRQKYTKYSPEDLIKNFQLLLTGKKITPEYLEIFDYFNYTENGKVCVPVYDKDTTSVENELYNYVLDLIKKPLKEALRKVESRKNLLSVSHGVDVKDISNEIYHLIFGEVNELLVENNLVSEPDYFPGEGRYLKSFEI